MSLANIRKPILYSTMTRLAYNINNMFYDSKHYMWCTPYFGTNYDSPEFMVPPSSSPIEIYNILKKEVESGDNHSYKIDLNKQGIKKGADSMLALGKISEEEHKDIFTMVNLAGLDAFKPFICVIPRIEVIPYYKKVKIEDKANPLSHEYILSDLPEELFDMIKIS